MSYSIKTHNVIFNSLHNSLQFLDRDQIRTGSRGNSPLGYYHLQLHGEGMSNHSHPPQTSCLQRGATDTRHTQGIRHRQQGGGQWQNPVHMVSVISEMLWYGRLCGHCVHKISYKIITMMHAITLLLLIAHNYWHCHCFEIIYHIWLKLVTWYIAKLMDIKMWHKWPVRSQQEISVRCCEQSWQVTYSMLSLASTKKKTVLYMTVWQVGKHEIFDC